MPYDRWPSGPVPDPTQAANRFADALEQAWAELETARRAVLAAIPHGRRAVTDALKTFRDAVADFKGDVAAQTERFVTLHLAPAYVAGADGGFPGDPLEWTDAHQAAVTSLASDTFDDILARSEQAGRTAEQFARAVRQSARDTVPRATQDQTARQAGRALEKRLVDDYALDHVTYANGTRMPVRPYTQMVARTKSAVAQSTGMLNECKAQGVGYMEVRDGAECGFSSHDDKDKANGTIRTIDECFQYPISHPTCVASGTLVVPVGSVEAAYRTEYHGPMLVLSTVWAERLTVTPNHPVLTGRGWLPASALRVGDHLLGYRPANLPPSVSDLNLHQVPTRIEDVLDALRPAGTSSRGVAAGTDFHGDAVAFKGEVEIVWAEGVLRDDVNSEVQQVGQDGRLMSAVGLPAVPSESGTRQGVGITVGATGGGVSSLYGGRVVGPLAHLDSVLGEAVAEGPLADAGLVCEASGGFPGTVSVDEVAEVRYVASWHGHVYDLTTSSGVYVADGIVVHNCTRGFGPRVDVRNDADAKAARSSQTPEQLADQEAHADYFRDRRNAGTRVTPYGRGQSARARRTATAARRAQRRGISV